MTGRRAFGEGTQVERAYAILKDDPPALTTVNPKISPALELPARARSSHAKEPAMHRRAVRHAPPIGAALVG